MRTMLLSLVLVGCAQMHPAPMPDAGVLADSATPLLDDASQPTADAGPAPLTGSDLCAAALARNMELGCQPSGPGAWGCPVQWNGAEQCDQARAQTCLASLAERAMTCSEARVQWRADCLTACSPISP